MNLSQFNAEESLGPTMGLYRGKAVFGRSGTGEVLPMQGFLASSTLSRNRPCPNIDTAGEFVREARSRMIDGESRDLQSKG
jgi:hypothetical protein